MPLKKGDFNVPEWKHWAKGCSLCFANIIHLFTIHNMTRTQSAHTTFHFRKRKRRDSKNPPQLPQLLCDRPESQTSGKLCKAATALMWLNDWKHSSNSNLSPIRKGEAELCWYKIFVLYATLLVIKFSDLWILYLILEFVWSKLIYQWIVSQIVCSFQLVWSLRISRKNNLTSTEL